MADRAHSTTRRALVSGLAAIPVTLGSCSGVRLVVAAAPHPDAEILRLGAEAADLIVAATSAADRFTAAEEYCCEATGPAPVQPGGPGTGWVPSSRLKEQMSQYEAERARYDAHADQVEALVGLSALFDASNEADKAVWTALETLMAMRATTVAGLIVKAKAAAQWRFDALRDSVLSDLLTMEGHA